MQPQWWPLASQIEVANKKNIELYEFESAQEAEAAAKIQVNRPQPVR